MNFLKELDLEDEVIDKIKANNTPSIVRQFICDRENAKKLIIYFKEIGISVVDELLIRRLEIFSIDYKRVKKAIENYNTPILVALINEDISAINFL